MWEVDWAREGSTGARVWAINMESPRKDSRVWKLRSTGELRRKGVNTPTYRKDSWEIDWKRRNGKQVWARNPSSKMPTAREWHWIRQSALALSGIRWKPVNPTLGRCMHGGYVVLTRRAMTDAEIELAENYNLFGGRKKRYVLEHRLVAANKYGDISGKVVRHLNGIRDDNREDNLVTGTSAENTMDHNTARMQAMFWHNQYDSLVQEVMNGTAREFIKKHCTEKTQ